MRAVLPIMLLLSLKPLAAATYYIDAEAGNDQWTGTSPYPTGSPRIDGPWLTLSRVAAASLFPGDTVLLKCAQAWHETLTIQASGTASQPITVGAYPTSCTTPPEIDGSMTISASSWTQYRGSIYKASLENTDRVSSLINLIDNSSLNTSLSGWRSWSQANDAAMTPTSKCQSGHGACMRFFSGTNNSLLISNNFALHRGIPYTLRFSAKVPAGQTLQPIVRRAATPWDQLGLSAKLIGTGMWQSYSLHFLATGTLDNARLDFNVPRASTITLDDVRLETKHTDIQGVFENRIEMNPAHHPNRGYDTLHPESIYYTIAKDSASTLFNGHEVSTYVTSGADVRLPSRTALTPGTRIRIRTVSWKIDDRTIASIAGKRLNLDKPSSYPIRAGWGYYFYNQLWMLDEPGEYFHDVASDTLYVWMPDSAAPGDRISIGEVGAGVDIRNASYLTIDGIAVRNTQTGIRVRQANSIVLRNVIVEDVVGMGVDATDSTDCEISDSHFARTGSAAISGADGANSLRGFSILDNDISETGVRRNEGIISSLPVPTGAAVKAGYEALVSGNIIRTTGYNGVTPFDNSVVSDNYLEDSCLVLDDGGAIYLFRNNNTLIEHNTVVHVAGSPVGAPDGSEFPSQGIYLDSLTSGASVTDNTIVDARDGIHLHNAYNNYIGNNTLYGNRHYGVFLQEDSHETRAEGDLYDNVVHANRFFPTSIGTPIRQQSTLRATDEAASYDENVYFTLLRPRIALEVSPAGNAVYTLSQWQTATTNGWTSRKLDPFAVEVSSDTTGYTTYEVTGENVVPNGSLTHGISGWTAYSATAPYGKRQLINCLPGACIRYLAGESTSLLSSPNFSIVGGQWYRVSFDLQSNTANQPLYIAVRRGGGGSNGYESLIPKSQPFAPSTSWQRYSFIFPALKTVNANDPLTKDRGARVDFDGIHPSQTISVTNLEVVPITEPVARHHILTNPTQAPVSVDCPEINTEPLFCTQYVGFPDGQPIGWPYTLAANDSEVIYSRDDSLTDNDGDGIPDTQDSCSQTPRGLDVNALGCAFVQSYP